MDSSGTTDWSINGAGQVITVAEPSGQTVSYSYYPDGLKHTMTAGSETWTYTFDNGLWLASIGQLLGDSLAAQFYYNYDGSIQTRDMGANLKTGYTYDARGRVMQVTYSALSNGTWSVQQQINYGNANGSGGYDADGNVLLYTNSVTGGSSESTSYTYDYANRLTSEDRTSGAGQIFANQYAYDKAGNRISVTRNGVRSNYSVDANNKFWSGDGFGVSGYDADGNPATLTETFSPIADDAAAGFSGNNPSGDWSYGYETGISAPFSPYTN